MPRCRCVPAAQYVSDVLDVTYARCGVTEMDKQVEEAIENFTHSLTPVGPDLSRGTIVLAFFEKRKRYYFGVAKSTENVYWEQWSVPVIVNHRPRTAADNEVAGTCAPRALIACGSFGTNPRPDTCVVHGCPDTLRDVNAALYCSAGERQASGGDGAGRA